MQKIFEKYHIELEKEELEKFEHFLKIFIEKNSQINLSAIRDEEGIIEKHFIDSIMLNIFVELEWKVADLWTGGGFPLIPLAITNPQVQFTGIDSVGKKLLAVQEFADSLELDTVDTMHGRAEELWHNKDFRSQFDFVTSRATAYMPTLLEYVIPLLKVWGIFAAYKLADKQELKDSKKALIRLWAKILKVKNYSISGQDRTIILIEKIKETNDKYPRAVWIPLAKPIK